MSKWVVLGMGGTIAGTADRATDHTGYTAGQLGVQAVVNALPGLQISMQGDLCHCEQVAQLDSKDMDHATWRALAQRCQHWLAQPDVGGVVITHGTDTLEETAWFLQLVLASAKPVVLTCAMRPATAVAPDGPQNVLDALAVVRDPLAAGVLVVCAGRIHGAREVQKVHPYRLDAFDSGEAGALGWVEQGEVRWGHRKPVAPAVSSEVACGSVWDVPHAHWPWVAVLHSHAGADARLVQAWVDAGVRGLVLAGTGNGTVNCALLPVLTEAQARGVVVWLTTRCAQGQLVGAAIGPAAEFKPAPAGLAPHKARVSLMLALMAGVA